MPSFPTYREFVYSIQDFMIEHKLQKQIFFNSDGSTVSGQALFDRIPAPSANISSLDACKTLLKHLESFPKDLKHRIPYLSEIECLKAIRATFVAEFYLEKFKPLFPKKRRLIEKGDIVFHDDFVFVIEDDEGTGYDELNKRYRQNISAEECLIIGYKL